MIRLIGIELRRLLARRLTRVGVVLAVAAILVAAIIAGVSSKSSNPIRLFAMLDALPALGFAFALGGLVLGGSSLGAEWHAGTVMTQLTWEPRRVRVLVAKLVSCAIALFVLALVLQAALVGAFAAVAATRGSLDGVDAEWVRGTVEVALRVGVLTSLTGLLGLSLAALTRNTAAAVGIVFAEMAVLEALIRGLRPGWAPWLLGENSAVFLSGDPGAVFGPGVRTPTSSFLLLSAYAAALAIIGLLSFVRRDVN